MDSNTIAQLVAAFRESHRDAAPIVPVINQNSVLIWNMIIAAFTPILTALVIWITKKSTEMKLDRQADSLKEIHTEVNSKNTVKDQKLDTAILKIEELVKINATLLEKQRGHETGAEVAAAVAAAKGTPAP